MSLSGSPTLAPGTTLKLELPFALTRGAAAAVRALEADAAPAGTRLPPAPTVGDLDSIRAAASALAAHATRPGRRTLASTGADVAFLGACAAAAALATALSKAGWARLVANSRRVQAARRAAPLREALRSDGMPDPLPPWLRGDAVWRVRSADGGEAAVPLPPPGVVFGTAPPTRCWLAWESRADADAWAGWLVSDAGPLAGAARGAVVRAAPETLSAEAAASRRELVYMPAGAVRPAPGDGEAGVLAAVAAGAHPARGGAAIIRPELRDALDEEAGVASVPPVPTTADARPAIEADEVAVDLVGDGDTIDATSVTPPPPPPTAAVVGAAGWYKDLPSTAVPVLALASGGGGLVTIAGAALGPAPPPGGVVVAFEDRGDAERLAWAWHTSGTGADVGADVAKLVAMAPAELDAAAAETDAAVVVFRKGSLVLPRGGGSETLLGVLAAGVEAQLGSTGGGSGLAGGSF